MSWYLQPSSCPLVQLFSFYSKLFTPADKLGHLEIYNIKKKIQLPTLTSVQRSTCLLPQTSTLVYGCWHRKMYSQTVQSSISLSSVNQQSDFTSLFRADLLCSLRWPYLHSTDAEILVHRWFTVQVSRSSLHPSQPEASPSLWRCIPTPCQQLALILAWRDHSDPVQGAQSVIHSHSQAVLGMVPVPAQKKQQENAAQLARNMNTPFSGPLIRLV